MKIIYGCVIMIPKISSFLVSIFLLFSILYSQSEIDDLINEVYSGNINNAKEKLPAMKKEFSDINVSYGPNGIVAKARKN